MTGSLKKMATAVTAMMIAALVFAWTTSAAEFQADFIQKHETMEIKGKFYIKNNKMRTDMKMMGQQMSMITRMDKNVSWNVQHDAKMYFEMPIPPESDVALRPDEELAKIAVKKKIGSETINGYACDKYEIIFNDKSKGKIEQWVSRKLNFPIKIVYHGPAGVMTTEYYNIQSGSVDSSLFEVPRGFQKMSVPTMGSGMGGMLPKP
jgi:hypothetical protein